MKIKDLFVVECADVNKVLHFALKTGNPAIPGKNANYLFVFDSFDEAEKCERNINND